MWEPMARMLRLGGHGLGDVFERRDELCLSIKRQPVCEQRRLKFKKKFSLINSAVRGNYSLLFKGTAVPIDTTRKNLPWLVAEIWKRGRRVNTGTVYMSCQTWSGLKTRCPFTVE